MPYVTGPLTRRALALLTLVLYLTGCHSWASQAVSPVRLVAEEEPEVIRLTTTAGNRIVVKGPKVVGDSLTGMSEDTAIAVPLTDIERIELLKFDTLETVLVVVGPIAVLFAFLAVGCAIGDCDVSIN